MGFNFGSYKPNSMDGTSELVKSLKLSTCKMIIVTTYGEKITFLTQYERVSSTPMLEFQKVS